jgi:type II secretory pathway pseudopilin PulG
MLVLTSVVIVGMLVMAYFLGRWDKRVAEREKQAFAALDRFIDDVKGGFGE